jgi:hypothetical protein
MTIQPTTTDDNQHEVNGNKVTVACTNTSWSTSTGTSTCTTNQPIQLRRDGPQYTTYMDALMEDKAKGLGRKRKYEE